MHMAHVFSSLMTLVTITVAPAFPADSKHSFTLGEKEFLLNGKPIQIISGEIHPARVPKEYWRHRIQMAKAMGCNTIATYIFWNYHESEPGVWDFETGNRDLRQFFRLVQEEGMWALLRPGPYVCAEREFGGLPPYLLRVPDIKVRCMDPRYMAAAEGYLKQMASLLSAAGPIQGGLPTGGSHGRDPAPKVSFGRSDSCWRARSRSTSM
jgi:beta-galactosidase